MKIRISQIKRQYNDTRSPEQILFESLKIPPGSLKNIVIERESLDARRKNQPVYIYNFTAETEYSSLLNNHNVTVISEKNGLSMDSETITLDEQPIIVGAGPSGLFTALALLKKGYRPTLVERGKPVNDRLQDVRNFWNKRHFNPRSNAVFGEGGAGTFSDGKLTTRSKSPFVKEVLETFIRFGADTQIAYQAKPHLGTDKIRKIVINMRREIESLGGQFEFNSFLDDISIVDGNLVAVSINGRNRNAQSLILAIGNSAIETFEMLHHRDVCIEQKPYAIGVRVEHPQNFINNAQFGPKVDMNFLEAAEYILTHKCRHAQRGVYSFCMCPGGKIICSSSHNQQLVLNGMSYSTRNLPHANSAIVVSVDKNDFKSINPLAGLKFRNQIEEQAYEITSKPFQAPVQRIKDFMDDNITLHKIKSSYSLDVCNVLVADIFPAAITQSLKESFLAFDQQIKGFIENGILLAPETRTSNPLRIIRDPAHFTSVNTNGIFPLGEGAGYAGGIMSCAVDALHFVSKVKSILNNA